MDELTFRDAQLGALEILRFIDVICRKNGIQYFLMYGSLIGAVREKGIIPWDDDIDIIMPRPDYDRFIKVFSENNNKIEYFRLFEKTLVTKYPHPIARLSDMRYKIVFDNEKDYGIGLFVDIYPLDGVGNDYDIAHRNIRKSYYIASLCFLTSRKRFGRDNTSSVGRMILKFPAYLWANLMGNKHYINKSRKQCMKNSYEDSRYVTCVAQPFRERGDEDYNIYEKEWFEPISMEFEGEVFPVPKGYDMILAKSYGDYMTPPPEDQRKTHHTYDAFVI